MAGASEQADEPIGRFADAAAFESWLSEHAEHSTGIRIAIAKKGSGIQSISYDEALDVALCFGWIDARKQSLDEKEWLQRFTPRSRRSGWSKINRDHIERLEAAGRLTERGWREVDAAKTDGRWDAAYAGQRAAEVPADFMNAMEAHPGTRERFDALNSVNRYAFIYRIGTAKKPETRARRIETFVGMLERGETFHP